MIDIRAYYMRLETQVEEVHQTVEIFELLSDIGGQMGEKSSYALRFYTHFLFQQACGLALQY
jgi:hypothetical protein